MNRSINLKTPKEIKIMKEGGKRLKEALEFVVSLAKPGVTENELDRKAREKVESLDSRSAFLGYNGFPKTLIFCRNEGAVHGIPSDEELKEGDLITLDLGLVYKKFYTDKAISFVCGGAKKNLDAQRLIEITEEAFWAGFEFAKPGNLLNDISGAIGSVASKRKVSVIKQTTGHGIGRTLHEDPILFNYSNNRSDLKLKPGMVFCIEPVFAYGSGDIYEEDDGWLLRTADRNLSSHYENTIAITSEGAEILTL